MAKLRLVGAVGIKVRPDTSDFREEVDRALNKIPDDVTVDLNIDLDTKKLKRDLDKAEKEAEDRTIDLKVGVTREQLLAAKRKIEQSLSDLNTATIPVKLDEAGLRNAMDKVDGLLAKSKLKIEVDPSNLNQLKAERKKIQDALDGVKVDGSGKYTLNVENNKEDLHRAKSELDDLVKKREAQIKAEAITWEAAWQLAYASRARDVPFYVHINQRSLAIAEETLGALAGLNALREGGQFLENMITNFDTFSLKAGAVSTAIGSIADTAIFAATALLPLGEGILNLTGLLAYAPVALSALSAAVLVNVMGFQGFADAAKGNNKELAKLPYAARKAALELRGTWEQMQQPVQNAFWDGMADSILAFATDTIPVLGRGLTSVADDIGRFNAGILNSFHKIAMNGELEKMFAGVEGFFQNAAKGTEPFFDAINRIGLRGSELLPKFGSYLTDMANRFDAWIKKSDEAGKITGWMEAGVQSLQDLWSMGGGVIKMFEGLTTAAKTAGAAGLGPVADEFNRIGDIMKGEPFQSRLATIFDGARSGASALNVGVKELGVTLGEASLFVANLLSQLGKLGGQTLSGLSKLLGNLTFQDGILRGLQGMSTMLDGLQTGFYDLGSVIGNLSNIAGAAFSNIAPVANNVIALLDTVVGTLEQNISNMIPNLMGLVNGLVSSLAGPIQSVAEILNTVLGFINSLPQPLASLTTGLMGFLLMAGKIGPMFEAKPGGLLEKIKYDFGAAEGAGGKFMTVAKGIGAGALSLVGGPWGLAMGAVSIGFALAGQKAAEAKAQTDAYSAAIDENTGKINANAAAIIAKKIVDDTQQAGVKSASEVFKTLGFSIEDVSNIVAEGGPEYDQLISKLKDGAGAADEMATHFDDAGLPIQGNADKWNEWTKSVNIGKDALNGLGLEGAINLLESQKGSLDANKNSWLQRNDATDRGNQSLRDFNQAMTTYNDKTATADSRTRALKQALDILNGKQPSLEEAQLKVNDAMRAAEGTLANVNGQMKLTGGLFRDAEGNVKDFNGVINASSGVINTATSAGAELYRGLQDTTNGVLAQATAMKDAGKPTEEIAAKLKDSRDQFIKMGEAAGLNGDLVAAAYDHMIGANPKDLITTITAQGVDEAKSRIDNYKGTLDQVNAYKAVAHLYGDDAVLGEKLANSYTALGNFDNFVATATANLNADQANAVRQDLLNKLYELAMTNPTVLANMDPKLLEEVKNNVLAELKDLGNQRPTPEVLAETEDAKNKLANVQGMLDKVHGTKPQPKVEPQTADANSQLDTTKQKLQDVGNQKPNPSVSLTGAPAVNQALDIMAGKLDPFNGKLYSFQVKANTDSESLSLLKALKGANGGIVDGNVNPMYGFGLEPFANGGFHKNPAVKYFANGGYENHVAQIARPNSVFRVWAEPETGGEAYIPLASSKRERSTAILNQVAQQFGYNLTPAQAFADGGVVAGGNSRNSGLNISIETFNQNANDTVEDVGRGLMRQVRNAGMSGIMDGI